MKTAISFTGDRINKVISVKTNAVSIMTLSFAKATGLISLHRSPEESLGIQIKV